MEAKQPAFSRRPASIVSLVFLAAFLAAAAMAATGDVHWDTRFGWAGVTNYVNALAYRDGKLCVVGQNPPGGLGPGTTHSAVELWDGTGWVRLGTIQGRLQFTANYAAAFVGNDLYVGGSFSNVNGVAASGLARWDGVQWSSVGGFSGTVLALASDDVQLFVGGMFERAGTVPATNVARWNGSGWSAMGPGLGVATTDRLVGVRTLLWTGSELFAGGGFATSGGVPTRGIARWNGATWDAVGGGITANPGEIGRVNALAWNGTELFIGGLFTSAGGTISPNLARWNGDLWRPLLPGNVQDQVDALAALGGDIYIGGGFTNVVGRYAPAIARWNGNNWFAAGIYDGPITSLLAFGTNLVAGGLFSQVNGIVVNHVARRQGNSWSPLGQGNGLSLVARKIIATGDGLYAGGFFTGAGDVAANRIARWEGTQWTPLGGGITGVESSLSATVVAAIALNGSELYAGGTFTNAGGLGASNIARWTLPSGPWEALGPGLNGAVQSLTTAGNLTYAGGLFTSAGHVPLSRIAAWNGSSWSEVGGGVDSNVNVVVSSPNGLYLGGRFNLVGGSTTANRVARWDGLNWHSLGSGSENGVNGSVFALAVHGPNVYVGGSFTAAGTVPAERVAHWNGSRWLALGSGFGGGSVNDLLFHNGYLYAGGSFTNAGGMLNRGIARWDGTNWSPLGSGLSLLSGTVSVLSLAAFDNDLFVGGQFSGAGGKDSRYFARWNEVLNFGPSLHLVSPQLGPQSFQVRVVANRVPRYVLEATTNFAHWFPLVTNSAASFDYADPDVFSVPIRCYRAREF